MPTFAGRPSTMRVLWCRWSFRRILWLTSRDSKYRSCNSTFPNPQSFLVGKYDSKVKWLPVLIFHRKQCYGSKKERWLIHLRNWSPRDQFVERIFQISRCWTPRLLLLWTRSSIIPTFHEEDRSLSWCATTFEKLVLMTQFWIMLIYSLLLFMMIIFRNSIQDGTKFYYQCQRFPPVISWKVCTNWEYVSQRNSRPYWNWTIWRFIRRYRVPNIKKIEDTDEEEYRSEVSIAKFWRQTRENWNRTPVSRGRNVSRNISIQGKSNHGAILRQPCRYHSKSTCTRSPCEYWHPPECQFYKTDTGCTGGDKCLFPHHNVDEQPNKKSKKGYYSHKRECLLWTL